jgi:magnesium transporter
VFVGPPRAHTPRLTGLRYDADAVEPLEIASPADIPAAREADGTTWITLDGVHDTDLVEAVGAQLGLPGLLLEDIVNTNQRPKLDLETGGVAFATLSAISYEGGSLHAEQVSLVWNRDYLLLFTETPTDLFDAVVERLHAARGRIRTSGPDYLAFALLDVVVDGYFVALEGLALSIEALEESIIDNPEPAIQHRLNAMRRELIALRRAVWPVRELAGGLVRAESPLIDGDIAPFLRDLYDHAVQVMDTVETQRELLGSLRDLYMTGLSNRMNEVMKVLTIVGTIFIPLSFVTGLYGMNFEYIPELGFHYGYFVAWGLMLTMVAGMLIYFRRKDWI